MTREEYEKLFGRFMSFDEAVRPDRGELMHTVVDLFYRLEDARGRIYELEQTIDGREHEDEGNHTLTRSDWAWAEKEED